MSASKSNKKFINESEDYMKEYEDINFAGREFVLPPGEYTLATYYEEDLSGEKKHELISTEYIKV